MDVGAVVLVGVGDGGCVDVGVLVGVFVGVTVGVAVGVTVGDGVGVGEFVAVAVLVGVGVGVFDAVTVSVGEGATVAVGEVWIEFHRNQLPPTMPVSTIAAMSSKSAIVPTIFSLAVVNAFP